MEHKELLREGLLSLGLSADEKQLEQFRIYKETLLEYNKVMNLTAIEEESQIDIKHFLDSASCLCVDKISEGVRMIDVGTGAGFPSLPMKILCEDIDLTLMDSLQKRIRFLQEVCERMGLKGVTCLHSRAEDAGRDRRYRQQYDIAVARAVASLPVLLEYCTPFVKPGGYFICQKGPSVVEELDISKKAVSVLGCKVEELIDIEIPYSDLQHKILLIRKEKPTPPAYPRKAGKPSKEPIL